MMEPALIHASRHPVEHKDCKNNKATSAFFVFALRKFLYKFMPYTVHAQKVYEEVEIQLHSLLRSVNPRTSGHAHAHLPTWRTAQTRRRNIKLRRWQKATSSRPRDVKSTGFAHRHSCDTHVSPPPLAPSRHNKGWILYPLLVKSVDR
jgi:hypothetical protein